MEGTKGRISEMKDRTIEITQAEQQRENRWKLNEQSLKDLWDYSIHVIKILEGVEKEGRTENVLKETMAEIFPNLTKDINIRTWTNPKQDKSKTS